MKCPHCGMNLRDDITECGYCGGKITRKKERAAADAGKFTLPRAGPGQKAAAPTRAPSGDPEMDDEEGGGLSAVLQPGEQVLIGALNVSVKKFSFHAYLTNQRIFLIDTQEKKIKVTAKDVPRDTIVGSIVEVSESSDPVLVLSLRSEDDDVKTMKLVFVQGGTDRSAELDEWITLLQGEEPAPAKKQGKRPAPARPREPLPEEEPEEEFPPVRKPQRRPAPAKVQEPMDDEEYGEPEERPAPIRVPERARPRPELQPARRPVKKDHERQPPVKRLVSPYSVPEEEPVVEEEPAPEPEVVAPPRRLPIRQVIATTYEREPPVSREAEEEPAVAKPAVQSAMRVAMKTAIRQTGPVSPRPIRKTVIEPPAPVVEEQPAPAPARRPVVQESRAAPVPVAPERDEPKEATPQFCHNCGKKLPHSANFCPGCGTKLNVGRTLPHSRTSPTLTKKMTRTDPPGHENRPVPVDQDEFEEEKPVPTKPPIKKAPKGSEMTILHKFLRR